MLSPFFALFLSMALYAGQRRESGTFGGIAFILLFSGLVTLVALDYYGAFIRLYLPENMIQQIEDGPSAPVFIISIFALLIGEILFGISVLRAGVYSKIPAFLFMLGLLGVILHPTGLLPEIAVDVAATAVGISLIWWSIDLLRVARGQVGK